MAVKIIQQSPMKGKSLKLGYGTLKGLEDLKANGNRIIEVKTYMDIDRGMLMVIPVGNEDWCEEYKFIITEDYIDEKIG